MYAKKIKKQIFFDNNRIFGYIDLAPENGVNLAENNGLFLVQDIYDKKYECYLKSIVRISTQIPEVISYHCEGKSPETTLEVLKNRGVDITQNLAYYIFQKK